MKQTTNRDLTRRVFVGQTAGFMAGLSAGALTPVLADKKVAKSAWEMKLATSSVMFDTLPIEQVCDRVQGLGLQALDIWGPFKYAGNECDHLEDVRKRLGGKGLRALLDKHELEVAAFSLYQHSTLAQYWELIRDFGGGIVIRSDKAKPGRPEDLSKNMRAFFETLKPDIELANKSNAVLAIENHGGSLLNTLDSFKAFIDLNPNHERVGIAFAPYHLQGYETPMADFIKLAGPQMKFFYAWQRHGRNQPKNHQLPGLGTTDFTPWLQALAEAEYSQYLAIFAHEHAPADVMETNVAKARDYLLKGREKISS